MTVKQELERNGLTVKKGKSRVTKGILPIHNYDNGSEVCQEATPEGIVSQLNSNSPSQSPISTDITSSQPDIPKKEKMVKWANLPHKRQLAILTMARLSEPLVQTSLQSYLFYQLQSFDRNLPDSVISSQAGIMQGSFTAAQFLTAMLWGRVADSNWGGRKAVLMIGLLGTLLSCIGFGFSTTFRQAVFFRCLGGALNGNVGVMRTMVSEIIIDRRYQSRAFLLLPMTFNIGVIIGPVLGGLLADPAGSYPSLFGHVEWFIKFPYAPPNLLSAFFLLIAASGVFFGLEETLPSIRHREDLGSKCGRKVAELFRRCLRKTRAPNYTYTSVPSDEQPPAFPSQHRDVEMSVIPISPGMKKGGAALHYQQKLPFRRIFTSNVLCTLLAHGLLAMHVGTFNSLWFVFLSTPVADPANPDPHNIERRLPFIFTGGLGMPPRDIGFALAILGIIGISMQLLVYPAVNERLGVVMSWRIFLYCFPIAYALIPFLSIVPSRTPPPAEKDGFFVWLALCGILFIQVIGRTFALPATAILINNCSPHPSVLGTIHGLGQSVSSGTRTIGPILGGFVYGLSLHYGVIGIPWWALSCLAICGCIASNWVREGDGHEIMLEGDNEPEILPESGENDARTSVTK